MSSMEVIVGQDPEGRVVLKCPAVGVWRQAPGLGQLASRGQGLGFLEVLGRLHELKVPVGVRGVIVDLPVAAQSDARALSFGQVLVVLGDELGGVESIEAQQSASSGGLVFRSNSSGRFYLRPAPDKPAFVNVGDEIEVGHIVFLLEVMKTFSRIAYEGEGLPARAKVLRILPQDGDDLEPNQVVLELEAV